MGNSWDDLGSHKVQVAWKFNEMAWNVHWMILQAYFINWNGKGTHCFAGMPWLALWIKWQAPSMAWDVHCISRQAPVIAWDVMGGTYIFYSRCLSRKWDIKIIFRPFVYIIYFLYSCPFLLNLREFAFSTKYVHWVKFRQPRSI